MFRAYILLGFTILIAQLHISGNITKYINMKYAYLSTTAAIILGFLTIVQIIIVFQKNMRKNKENRIVVVIIAIAGMTIQKMRIHGGKSILVHIVLFSNCFGIIFPIATLDSDIVKAKGFHFPVAQAESTDPFMRRQF